MRRLGTDYILKSVKQWNHYYPSLKYPSALSNQWNAQRMNKKVSSKSLKPHKKIVRLTEPTEYLKQADGIHLVYIYFFFYHNGPLHDK